MSENESTEVGDQNTGDTGSASGTDDSPGAVPESDGDKKEEPGVSDGGTSGPAEGGPAKSEVADSQRTQDGKGPEPGGPGDSGEPKQGTPTNNTPDNPTVTTPASPATVESNVGSQPSTAEPGKPKQYRGPQFLRSHHKRRDERAQGR